MPIDTPEMANIYTRGVTDVLRVGLSDSITLRKIASYSYAKARYATEYDGTILPVFDVPFAVTLPTTFREITEEFQLQGQSFDNKLKRIGGLFYVDSRMPNADQYSQVTLGNTAIVRDNSSQTSAAVYAQGTYDLYSILEGLKFTAGIRQTWDKRVGSVQSLPAAPTLRRGKFKAATSTVGFDYQANPDTLLYVTSRRGYRSGGSNFTPPPTPVGFEAEYVTDVEAGIKAQWAVGGVRARTNIAVYHQWFTDIQISRFFASTNSATRTAVSNAGKVNIDGIEIESVFDLSGSLQLNASLAYYHKFSEDVHTKRIDSLANATLDVMTSSSLAVSIIGQSFAQARGLLTKHSIKQVDRLLSNRGIDVWAMFAPWVADMVGQRSSIVVAMDWTDFDADGRTTLALNMVTSHGRATPLMWLTVPKDELKDRRNDFEDTCLARLDDIVPDGVKITILADRGFGGTNLFGYLDELGFDYVIRFRGNIHVTLADGECRAAADWVGIGGRARKFRDAELTTGRHRVNAVVCVKAKGMKDSWCLAASDADLTSREIINYYAKRWTIEPGFRTQRICASEWGLASFASLIRSGVTGHFS